MAKRNPDLEEMRRRFIQIGAQSELDRLRAEVARVTALLRQSEGREAVQRFVRNTGSGKWKRSAAQRKAMSDRMREYWRKRRNER